MKQSLLLTFFLVLMSSVLFGQAPMHDDQIAIVSINGSIFIDYILDKAEIFGMKKEVVKEFEQVFAKNSGSDLRKDFHNIGFLIYQGKDQKFHFVGFKTGNFVPENWYGEFQAIARQPIASQHVKTELRQVNGVKIIDLLPQKTSTGKKQPPEISFFFQNNKRVFFGFKNEITLAASANFKDQPDAVQKQIEKQTFFLEANIGALNEKFQKTPNPGMQPVLGMLAPIKDIYIFYADGDILLRVNCVNEEAAKNFGDMLTGMVSSYRQKLENDLSALTPPGEGEGWLLSSLEYFGKKGTILSSKETMDSMKIAHEDNVFMLKGTFPPLVRTGLIPVAAIGTLAAISIPNFRAARNQARMKACFANQRVLLGATEMYNMDHQEMLREINDKCIQTLLEQEYLRSAPVCPDGGAYTSEGDLVGEGIIKCTVHGSVDVR